MQYALFEDTQTATKKSIATVPVAKCVVSRFNPRRTRSQADVEKLAQRINRNGFEITRALWAYAENGHYEVFAGGNRLEAAKLAELDEVPIVLHEGFSEYEISGLADEDNENDEYHASVPVVDVWMDYKRLADKKNGEGWTQENIAEAKGVSRQLVQQRLSYAALPDTVIDRFAKNDSLKESHAAEIRKLPDFSNLAPWRTFESVALETIENVLDKVRVKGPTANQFKSEVEKQNKVTQLAQSLYDKIESDLFRAQFVKALARSKASTQAEVKSAYNDIVAEIAELAREEEERLASEKSEAEAKRIEAEREAREAARQQEILAKIVLGDSTEKIKTAPAGFSLMIADPPYGKDFQSNRRVGIAKAAKIENDDHNAVTVLQRVIAAAYPRMATDATLFVWCDWRIEPDFRSAIESARFTIRGSYIWNKPNHGTGDLEGTFAPKHERIIHAVKGSPKLRKRPSDVLTGNKFLGTEHPTEKPIDLLQTLIEATTDEGDCIVDPFCGSGSTAIAAHQVKRDFWTCEIDEKWHRVAQEVLFNAIIR